MSDIGTFPTIVDGIMHNAGPTWGIIIAAGSISAGQVVGFSSVASTKNTVHALLNADNETIFGVAVNNASNGAKVTVALPGSIVTVSNADDGAAIGAGLYVQTDDNSVGGTVKVATMTTGSNSHVAGENIVGLVLEDIGADGTGKILVLAFEAAT